MCPTDIANVWRTRWLGLLAANCFRLPSQRTATAVGVLGALSGKHADDDLVYQLLTSLVTSLAQAKTDLSCSLVEALGQVSSSLYLNKVLAVVFVLLGYPVEPVAHAAVHAVRQAYAGSSASKAFKLMSEPALRQYVRDWAVAVGLPPDEPLSFSFMRLVQSLSRHTIWREFEDAERDFVIALIATSDGHAHVEDAVKVLVDRSSQVLAALVAHCQRPPSDQALNVATTLAQLRPAVHGPTLYVLCVPADIPADEAS